MPERLTALSVYTEFIFSTHTVNYAGVL